MNSATFMSVERKAPGHRTKVRVIVVRRRYGRAGVVGKWGMWDLRLGMKQEGLPL